MSATKKEAAKQRELLLPVSRIKTIMKSSPEVETIGQDSLFLITKATELFIQSLAQKAHQDAGVKDLQYNHLVEVIQTSDEYEFLREILPRKMKVKDILSMKNEESDDSD